MALRLSILVALVLSVVASAPAQPKSLFPIAAGNHWALRGLDSRLPRTVSIERGVSGLELYGFPGLTDGTRLRRAGTAVQVWEATRQRWETLLRFGAAGSKFAVDLPATTLWHSVEVTVASRRADIRDFRGRVHRGCTRFAFRYRGLTDAGLLELAFAPGVGLVRLREDSIAGPRTSLLVSATIR